MDVAKPMCPDRTAMYLLSLQTKYREDSINGKLNPGQQTQIVPANPFRVFLSFSILASVTVDVFYRNSEGTLVFYAEFATPTNITINQQQQFLLSTFEWLVIGANADSYTGTTLVKT